MQGQNIFRKDLIPKLLSLSFAILLWFFVVGEEKAEIGISIPLEIVNVPSRLVIANDIPAAIEVRVYGPRSMIRAIATQRLSITIDLNDAGPGRMTYEITPESLPLPGGVQPRRIKPSMVEIVLEPLAQKELPVKPDITGTVANNYEVTEISVDPPRVVLSCPSSELGLLEEVQTLPVDLNVAIVSFERQIGLDLEGLHCTAEGSGKVMVKVQVAPKRTTRRLNQVPVKAASGNRLSIEPDTVTVTVAGPVNRLPYLKGSDIVVTLPLKGIKSGTHMVSPTVKTPKDISVIDISPQKIKVTIH